MTLKCMKGLWHGTAPEVAVLFTGLAIQRNYDSLHVCTCSFVEKKSIPIIVMNHLNTDMALVCQVMFGNPCEHHILIMDKSLGMSGNGDPSLCSAVFVSV